MSLYKQKSWSPDTTRDEAWTIRRRNNRLRRRRSLTEDDVEELRACFDLGFDFDSPELDPKLTSAFPALGLYQTVNRNYYHANSGLPRCDSASSCDSDTTSSSTVGSPSSFIDPGDDPEIVKTRLKQWAQVVACSLQRQSSPNVI